MMAKLGMRQSYQRLNFSSKKKKMQGVIHTWFIYCYNAQALFQYPLTHLGRTPEISVRTDRKFNYFKIPHAVVVLAEMRINEDSKISHHWSSTEKGHHDSLSGRKFCHVIFQIQRYSWK